MTKLLDRNQELSHLDSDSIQDTNTNTRRRRQGSTTFESQDTDGTILMPLKRFNRGINENRQGAFTANVGRVVNESDTHIQ